MIGGLGPDPGDDNLLVGSRAADVGFGDPFTAENEIGATDTGVSLSVGQGGADAVHVLRAEADVKRFEIGPAQIIAAKTDRGENRKTRNGKCGQAACAQSRKAAPKPVELLEAEHRDFQTDGSIGR